MATATDTRGASLLGGLFGFGNEAFHPKLTDGSGSAPGGSLDEKKTHHASSANGGGDESSYSTPPKTTASSDGLKVATDKAPSVKSGTPIAAAASPTSVAEAISIASSNAIAAAGVVDHHAPDAGAGIETPRDRTSSAVLSARDRSKSTAILSGGSPLSSAPHAPPVNYEENEGPPPAMREVDYDVNATAIYKHIESRQWARAVQFLEDGEEEKTVDACSTWVLRKEKNGKLRWRLLPIHGAIMFGAPLPVVEALLEVFPYGARCKDDQGMLPLHLAFRNDATNEIITELIAAYPPTIHTKDRKGRIPLGCAMNVATTDKSRAKLIDAYAAWSVKMERDAASRDADDQYRKRVDDLQARQATDVDRVKKSFESSLMSNIERTNQLVAENESLRTEAEELRRRSEEKDKSESELTEKVRDLTKALEAMTQMKRAESARYENELSHFQQTRDDLLKKLKTLEMTCSDSQEIARRATAERAQEIVQKDVLRSSMDDLITNHRLVVDERDELLRRNDELTAVLERMSGAREGMRASLAKLEQDMNAAAVVRERMMAALAKQESDAAALAESEYDAMRSVLDRQGEDVEGALRTWGAGAEMQLTSPVMPDQQGGNSVGGNGGVGNESNIHMSNSHDHAHAGVGGIEVHSERGGVVNVGSADMMGEMDHHMMRQGTHSAASSVARGQPNSNGGGGAPRDIYISRSYGNHQPTGGSVHNHTTDPLSVAPPQLSYNADRVERERGRSLSFGGGEERGGGGGSVSQGGNSHLTPPITPGGKEGGGRVF